jgi:hypothetical protein
MIYPGGTIPEKGLLQIVNINLIHIPLLGYLYSGIILMRVKK